MEWHYLREILLNRHRDRGFGSDWSKREAASVGGLFHFKRKCDVGFWHKAALAHLLHSHLAEFGTRRGTRDFYTLSCTCFPGAYTPCIAVKGVGVPEIVLVRMDYVTTRIRFHQKPVHTGLAEDAPLGE